MCTFHDQHTVLVCNVAIGQVRQALIAAFGEAIQYTPVEGQGTLVHAPAGVKREPFQVLTRAAIARAQGPSIGDQRPATGSTPEFDMVE